MSNVNVADSSRRLMRSLIGMEVACLSESDRPDWINEYLGSSLPPMRGDVLSWCKRGFGDIEPLCVVSNLAYHPDQEVVLRAGLLVNAMRGPLLDLILETLASGPQDAHEICRVFGEMRVRWYARIADAVCGNDAGSLLQLIPPLFCTLDTFLPLTTWVYRLSRDLEFRGYAIKFLESLRGLDDLQIRCVNVNGPLTLRGEIDARLTLMYQQLRADFCRTR